MEYTKLLPPHVERMVGENDLYLEEYEGAGSPEISGAKLPLLFVHGAYTGSWMWSKFIPHFIGGGWKCYAMNLRSHYKSRVMDMTKITFEDYLEDVKEIISVVKEECGTAPVIIGFSLGGILCQKLAETEELHGMVLIDSCMCREVNAIAPYDALIENNFGMVVPAPVRDKCPGIDESLEDIAFQIKYLSMEAAQALLACGCWIKGIEGIPVDSRFLTCPVLVIKAVNSDQDDRRGRAEAEYFHAEYTGLWNTTHTGLLVGQRYQETANRVLVWLEEVFKRKE